MTTKTKCWIGDKLLEEFTMQQLVYDMIVFNNIDTEDVLELYPQLTKAKIGDMIRDEQNRRSAFQSRVEGIVNELPNC